MELRWNPYEWNFGPTLGFVCFLFAMWPLWAFIFGGCNYLFWYLRDNVDVNHICDWLTEKLAV
jgi:hypothetical protein